MMGITVLQERTILRVILADSSVQHLQMLQGYMALTCTDIVLCGSYQSGASLLEALQHGCAADIIITDYVLRDMDVPALYRAMQVLKLTHSPQILCSIEGQNDWQKNSLLSLGLNCYMIKPYHMEALFAKARTVCGMGRQNWDALLRQVLAECGFTEIRRTPYIYTYQALKCIMESEQRLPLAKEVYNKVAAMETVTVSAVETSLRRASAQAFAAGTQAYTAMCRRGGKPTDRALGNGAFLEMLVQELRRRAYH